MGYYCITYIFVGLLESSFAASLFADRSRAKLCFVTRPSVEGRLHLRSSVYASKSVNTDTGNCTCAMCRFPQTSTRVTWNHGKLFLFLIINCYYNSTILFFSAFCPPHIDFLKDLSMLPFLYRKIPIISPGLIFVQKAFCWAYFRGSLFSEGLVIGRNFAFQNGFGLSLKKQLKILR